LNDTCYAAETKLLHIPRIATLLGRKTRMQAAFKMLLLLEC